MSDKENSNELKKIPSVLAFEAKLVCSDALMMAGNWVDIDNEKEWESVKIQEKTVLGTISNYISPKKPEYKDSAKLDKKVGSANPQIVDNAALPFNKDTLKVNFTLKVLGNLSKPTACNNPLFQDKLSLMIENYIRDIGFHELANRYATNIANGRFLWRNRVCAEDVEIYVKINNQEDLLKFKAYKIGFDFSDGDNKNQDIKKLANIIADGLSDTTGELFAYIEVTAFAKLGKGQMVYPSQEMIMEKGDKSKTLYKLNADTKQEIAAMHSQKIGNALRTIDDWHSGASDIGAIAIEPFGTVTTRGKGYRHPTADKNDFYTLLKKLIINDDNIDEKQQHYVIANLIRGGVFSGEADKKDDKK